MSCCDRHRDLDRHAKRAGDAPPRRTDRRWTKRLRTARNKVLPIRSEWTRKYWRARQGSNLRPPLRRQIPASSRNAVFKPFLNSCRFNELSKPVAACRTLRISRTTKSLQCAGGQKASKKCRRDPCAQVTSVPWQPDSRGSHSKYAAMHSRRMRPARTLWRPLETRAGLPRCQTRDCE